MIQAGVRMRHHRQHPLPRRRWLRDTIALPPVQVREALAMPRPRQPVHSSPPAAPFRQRCPNCGERMRLVSIKPSPHFENLGHWLYWCDCGEMLENIIEERIEGAPSYDRQGTTGGLNH